MSRDGWISEFFGTAFIVLLDNSLAQAYYCIVQFIISLWFWWSKLLQGGDVKINFY